LGLPGATRKTFMTNPCLRIGIAGVGRMGRRHAENLAQKVPESELVAVCSPVAEELEWAKRELGVTQLYTDYAVMLARAEIDAVFIVTPTTLHAQQIVDALRARKHVFSEKPLSLDVAECRRVEAEAALQPDLKVMIGFVRRFDESYRRAHALIREGHIGRPLMVRSHTLDQNDPSGFFVRYSQASGGIFVDMSVHDVDAARWLLGVSDVARVFATGLVGLHRRFRLDAAAFGNVERQRLLREDVLACAQRVDDLLRVQRRRRDDEDGVDLGTREHHRVVGVELGHAELALRPFELFGDGSAHGDELALGDLVGNVLGVAAAHAADARDADSQSGIGHWRFPAGAGPPQAARRAPSGGSERSERGGRFIRARRSASRATTS